MGHFLVANQWKWQGRGWGLKETRGEHSRQTGPKRSGQTQGWHCAGGGRHVLGYSQSSSIWHEVAGTRTREGSEVSSWTTCMSCGGHSTLWALTLHRLPTSYSSAEVSTRNSTWVCLQHKCTWKTVCSVSSLESTACIKTKDACRRGLFLAAKVYPLWSQIPFSTKHLWISRPCLPSKIWRLPVLSLPSSLAALLPALLLGLGPRPAKPKGSMHAAQRKSLYPMGLLAQAQGTGGTDGVAHRAGWQPTESTKDWGCS